MVIWNIENKMARFIIGFMNLGGLIIVGWATNLIDHWYMMGFT